MRYLFCHPLKKTNVYDPNRKRLFTEDVNLPFDPFQPTIGYMWWKALNRLNVELKVHTYNQDQEESQLNKIIRLFEKYNIRGSTRIKYFVQKKEFKIYADRLVQAIIKNQPDVVLLFEPEKFIDTEVIRGLKTETSAKIVLMMGTSPVAIVNEKVRKAAPYFDYIFCNDFYHSVQWRELGAKNVADLPIAGCDSDYHRSIVLDEKDIYSFGSDVSFIGRLLPLRLYSERIAMLKTLTKFNLGIWTDDVSSFDIEPMLKPFYRGMARGDNLIKAIVGSRISINLHGHTMQMGGNMRTFEIPGTKTFQLIDRYNPAWFTENKEIVSFRTPSELKEKIYYYLDHNNELEAIAAAGQQRAYTEHTYEHRAARLLEKLSCL